MEPVRCSSQASMSRLAGSVAFVVALSALAPAAAIADEPDISGKYDTKFEEVQNSCTNTGMTLRREDVELTRGKQKRLDVTIPMVPLMKGATSKGGKFN